VNPASENVVAPYVSHRFEVVLNLDNPPAGLVNPLCNAAFSECNGLDMTMEPKTYQSGGDNQRQHHRPGPVSYGRLTLRRGLTNTLHLWEWFSAAATPGQNLKAQGEITLWDAAGTPRLTYIVVDCLPVKLSGPSFDAKSPQIAVEELQLVYATLNLRPAGQAGAGLSVGISAGIGAGAGVSVSGGPGLSASASIHASAKIGLG
jgi:phage tail-like protein